MSDIITDVKQIKILKELTETKKNVYVFLFNQKTHLNDKIEYKSEKLDKIQKQLTYCETKLENFKNLMMFENYIEKADLSILKKQISHLRKKLNKRLEKEASMQV